MAIKLADTTRPNNYVDSEHLGTFPVAYAEDVWFEDGTRLSEKTFDGDIQKEELPIASADELGNIYQYVGASGTYATGFFYKCVSDGEDPATYSWAEQSVQSAGSEYYGGRGITVTANTINADTNVFQGTLDEWDALTPEEQAEYDFIATLDDDSNIVDEVTVGEMRAVTSNAVALVANTKGEQYSTMPTPEEDIEGKVVQYVGATTSSFTNGFFYECVSDGEDPATYSWEQKNVQPSNATANDVSYDNTTSELNATNVQDAIDEVVGGLGTASGKDFTDEVRPNSHDLVESIAVYSAINNALNTIYTPRGDLSCSQLTSDLLIADNVGDVYQMSDAGTTSSLFINGAGITINKDDNVGIIKAGADEIMFNYMGSAFDLHDYQKKDLTTAVEGQTTVEGALGALSTDKQSKDLANTVESATTVEGALGALSNNKQAKTLTTSVESQTTVEGALGALSINKATQAEVNDIVNVLGAKNLFDGSINTTTAKGVTFTQNADGTISVTGSNTQGGSLGVFANRIQKLKAGSYILNGCPSPTSGGLHIQLSDNDAGILIAEVYDGNEVSFTLNADTNCKMMYWASGNLSITGTLIIKPMIRLASDPDNTYEPYAMTNQQLTTKTDGLWDNTMNNGAVNLLENVGTTTTTNGITFTVNSDGTVTVSGTATANASLTLKMRPYLGNSFPLKLSGCPAGGSFSSGYRLQYANYFDMTDLVSDEGDGAIITKQIDYATYPNARISIEVRNGTQISSPIVFKPMISDASLNLSYNDYVPYAKTNKELTDVIPSDASASNKLVTESDFTSYGIKTIWTGSKTKGDTGMNFDASPYDLCFAQVGGTWCRLITGVGGGSTTRKKFSALYAGRDYVNAGTYEQYYLLDIVPDGTIATCGWFDIAAKDTQNARLAGQKALELAIAGTSTWTDPTWRKLSDVETSVSVSKIIGIKFQTKS